MKAFLWVALFASAGCFAISLTPNWKYTVMSNEYSDCVLRRVANLRKAGRIRESINLSMQCMEEYDRKMAEEFGTKDISKMPEAFW